MAEIKNFCSDPGLLLLTVFAKDLTGCFSHCCVEGVDRRIYVCIFIVQDGERCKFPTYHNLEGFQHIGLFPGPSSGCFMMTKSVRQHKIVKGGKLQESESSLT